MSIDKSLRRGSRLSRSRNVLKRGERIEQLKSEDRWEEGQAIHLPKTRVIRTVVGKKKKKKTTESDDEK